MRCLNPQAKQHKRFLKNLADAARLQTTNVRVIIPQGEFVTPCMVGGRITLPTPSACGGALPFARYWLHELQHADDFRSGRLDVLTLKGAEKRARAAETTLSEGLVLALWAIQ
jgi:hypothetical protein